MWWKNDTSKNWNNDTSKNSLYSFEYEVVLKRIAELNAEFQLLKANVEGYKTTLDNLRGNFSRKLRGMAEDEKKEIETINKDDFVGFG